MVIFWWNEVYLKTGTSEALLMLIFIDFYRAALSNVKA